MPNEINPTEIDQPEVTETTTETTIEPIYKHKDGRIFTKSQFLSEGVTEDRISTGLSKGLISQIGDTEDPEQQFKHKDGRIFSVKDFAGQGVGADRIANGLKMGLITPIEKKNQIESTQQYQEPVTGSQAGVSEYTTNIPQVDIATETEETPPPAQVGPLPIPEGYDAISKAMESFDLKNRKKSKMTTSKNVMGQDITTITEEPDEEAIGQSKKVDEELKSYGIEANELYNKVKDLPEDVYNIQVKKSDGTVYNKYSKENLTKMAVESPVSFDYAVNTFKNRFALKNAAKKLTEEGTPTDAVYLSELYNSLNQAPTFDQLEQNFIKQQELINTYLPTMEERRAALNRAKDNAAMFITPNNLDVQKAYDQSPLKGKVDINQFSALEVMRLYEPEKYKQTIDYIETPTPVSIGRGAEALEGMKLGEKGETTTSFFARLGKEKILKKLSDEGRNYSMLDLQRQNEKLIDASKNATSQEQLDSIKQQYDDNNALIQGIRYDFSQDKNKYPLLNTMQYQTRVKDYLDQSGMNALEYGVTKFGLSLSKTGKSLSNLLISALPENEVTKRIRLSEIGERDFENFAMYMPEKYQGKNPDFLFQYSPSLKQKLDDITKGKDYSDLTDSEKNKMTQVMMDNQDQIKTITNPKAGKDKNFFSLATLYSNTGMLGDIASFAAQAGILKGVGVASDAMASAIPMWTTSQDDFYKEGLEIGVQDPNSYAFTNASIMFLAGLINPSLKIVKRAVGVNSAAGKMLAGVSEKTWNDVVNKNSQLLTRIKNSVSHTVKEAGGMAATFGAGTSIASDVINREMYGQNISNDQILDNAFESVKHILTSSAGLLTIGAITNFKGASMVEKSALWQLSDNKAMNLAAIEEAFKSGKISEDQAASRKKIIEDVSDIVNKMPNKNSEGKLMTDEQRLDYFYNLLLKKQGEEQKSALPKPQQEKVDYTDKVLDYSNNLILEPKTTEELNARKEEIKEALSYKFDENGKPIELPYNEWIDLVAELDAIVSHLDKKEREERPTQTTEQILANEPGTETVVPEVKEEIATTEKPKTGVNQRGGTWEEVVTEKDGIKTTRFKVTRKDGRVIQEGNTAGAGGRQMSFDDFLEEYNVNQEDLDVINEAGKPKSITINEIREGSDGRNGMTITVDREGQMGGARQEIRFTKKSKETITTEKPIEGVEAIDEDEVMRQMKPITDGMADVERQFKNEGYDIDWDYDNEIQILDKDGEQVGPEDLPENLRKLAGQYEYLTSNLGDFDQKSFIKSLNESRKVVETEAEVVGTKPTELPEAKPEAPKVEKALAKKRGRPKKEKEEKAFTIASINRVDAKKAYEHVYSLDVPQDASGLAMHWLSMGGKVSPESFAEDVLGYRRSRGAAKIMMPSEARSSEFTDSKSKLTIDRAAHQLWESLPEEMRDDVTTQDIRNALIDALGSYEKRIEVAKDFISQYDPEEAVKKFYEKEIEENREEYDTERAVIDDWYNERASEDFDLMLDENFVNKLIKEYEQESTGQAKGITEEVTKGEEGRGAEKISGGEIIPEEKRKSIADKIRGLKSEKGKTYDAVLGIPVAIWDGSIELIAKSIEAGEKVSDAIKKGIAYINENYKDKWDVNKYFNKVNEQFTSSEKTSQKSIPTSNKGISDVIQKMRKENEDIFDDVVFNWADAEVFVDYDGKISFKAYPGRDRMYSRGKEGGSFKPSKKEFINWLVSDEPFDSKKYVQDESWVNNIKTLRQSLGIVETKSESFTAELPQQKTQFNKNINKSIKIKDDTQRVIDNVKDLLNTYKNEKAKYEYIKNMTPKERETQLGKLNMPMEKYKIMYDAKLNEIAEWITPLLKLLGYEIKPDIDVIKLLDNIDLSKVKTISDKIREFKSEKGRAYESILGIPVAIWDGAIELVAKTAETTEDIVKIIKAGIDHIKESDWYKNLSSAERQKTEKDFTNKIKSLLGAEEPTKVTIETEHPFLYEGTDEKRVAGLMRNLLEAENVSEETKRLLKKGGVEYKTANNAEAEIIANDVIKSFGEQDALKIAEGRDMHPSVRSAIYAKLIDNAFREEMSATNKESKLEAAQKQAELSMKYSKELTAGGQFTSYAGHFYRTSPLAFVFRENAEREKRASDWYSGKKESYKEIFEKIKDVAEVKEEIAKEVEKALKEERKERRAKRDKNINDFFDSAKIKGGTYSIIIPPAVWNTAMEGLKKAVKAGDRVADAVQEAINEISKAIGDSWDKEKFRKDFENKLSDIADGGKKEKSEADIAEGFKKRKEELERRIRENDFSAEEYKGKKTLSEKEKAAKEEYEEVKKAYNEARKNSPEWQEKKAKQFLEKFKQKFPGLNEEQKRKVVIKSIKRIAESGGLSEAEFRDIITQALGIKPLTEAEVKEIEGLVNKINAVTEAQQEMVKNPTEANVKAYEKSREDGMKSALDLYTFVSPKSDITNSLKSIITGSFLGVFSNVLNVGANIINQPIVRFPIATIKQLGEGTLYGMSILGNKFGLTSIYEPTSNLWEAQKGYFQGLKKGAKRGWFNFKSGTTEKDYFGKTTFYSNLNPSLAVKDIKGWWKGDQYYTKKELADRAIRATIGWQPDFILRSMSLGDKPFRWAAEYARARQIARMELKIKNENEVKAFLANPKEFAKKIFTDKGDSEAKAEKKAQEIEDRVIDAGNKAVFEVETVLSWMSKKMDSWFTHEKDEATLNRYGKSIGAVIKAAQLPFIRIPAYIYWTTYKIINPELSLAQMIYHLSEAAVNKKRGDDAKSRKSLEDAKDNAAMAAYGFGVAVAAASLVNGGYVRPSNDEETSAREAAGERTFGKSGVFNMGRMMGTKDWWVDLKWFGPLGGVLNVRSKLYNSRKKEALKEKQEDITFIDEKLDNLTVGAAEGLNNLIFNNAARTINAIKGPSDAKKEWVVYNANTLQNVFMGATYAQLSKAMLPYQANTKADDTISQINENTKTRNILYRLAVGMPKAKLSVWGEPIKQNNTLGGIMSNVLGFKAGSPNQFGLILFDDYQRTMNDKFFPMPEDYNITVNEEKVELTESEKYDLDKYIGQARKEMVGPFVYDMAATRAYSLEDPSAKLKVYSELNDEEKIEALKWVYNAARDSGYLRFTNDPKYTKYKVAEITPEKMIKQEFKEARKEIFEAEVIMKPPTP